MIRAAPEDLADRVDAAPQLRLTSHGFREAYGRSAEGIWYAPGVANLLVGLTVCGRWGAIVAGARRNDGILQLGSLNRPAEPVSLPLSDVGTADLPPWAVPIVRAVEHLDPGGASLFCSVDLPPGSGLSSPNALACAAALALRDMWQPELSLDQLVEIVSHSSAPSLVKAAFAGYTVGASLGDAALLVIDTRIRRDAKLRLADFPALDFGSVAEGKQLGRYLTAFHLNQRAEPEQDLVVAAALKAGALGASLLLDEPGRPVVALTDPARLGAIRAQVSRSCREKNFLAPRYLTIRPSGGACRIAL